jgi:hypothetical protein
MTPPHQWPTINDVTWAAIAVLGGIARYLDSFLKGQTIPTWSKMIAHAFVSGFSGYMIAMAVMLMKPEWVFIAAGVAGYLGTTALDILADVIRKRVGAEDPKDTKVP